MMQISGIRKDFTTVMCSVFAAVGTEELKRELLEQIHQCCVDGFNFHLS